MSLRPGAPRRARLFLVPAEAPEAATPLDPLDLAARDGDRHDEDWLQRLIHAAPEVLPAEEIEPAFDRLIPLCRELPLRAGGLDNLLMTPRGHLALVECKLWRNPEARRKVVAQILDYAESLSGWSVERLEDAAHKASGAEAPARGWLHRLAVAADPEAPDEAAFHDALARNLRLGRLLLIILGDGIREDAEALVGLLAGHAGAHFTLALVEAPVHTLPDGRRIVAPSVLMRTEIFERAVVRIEDGAAVVSAPPTSSRADAAAPPRARSLTEDEMRESLRTLGPGLPERLDAFAARAATALGAELTASKSALQLRLRDDALGDLLLLSISPAGRVFTNMPGDAAKALGEAAAYQTLQRRLAAAVGGTVRETKTETGWYVLGVDGREPPLSDLLAQEDAWLEAMRGFIDALRAAAPPPP